jgi:putative hydrolase of the HAD superfamily
MHMRAVLFDLDNTLTHREKSIQRYAQHLIECYKASLNDIYLEEVVTIIHRIDCGGYPKKEMLTHRSIAASVAYALLSELNWVIKPSLEELTHFWFDQFGKNAVAMEGAEELLKALQQLNLKLAVISNGGHATRLEILNGLGFSHYFDVIMSSEKMGITKPNPEIFIQTCKLLDVEPIESLFVGDHPINDIQGAQNAGMKALFLEGFHHTNLEVENRVSHLNDVLEFI